MAARICSQQHVSSHVLESQSQQGLASCRCARKQCAAAAMGMTMPAWACRTAVSASAGTRDSDGSTYLQPRACCEACCKVT